MYDKYEKQMVMKKVKKLATSMSEDRFSNFSLTYLKKTFLVALKMMIFKIYVFYLIAVCSHKIKSDIYIIILLQ